MSKFIQAVGILSGMIIGVGMFGIPFSFVQAGFFLGTLELLFLTGFVLLFHLLYADIVLRTHESHRLPGYVRMYLGGRVARIAWYSALFGIFGTLLAYIVLGAAFLNSILGYFSIAVGDTSSVLLFGVVGSAVALIPFRKETLVNSMITALLILTIIFFVVLLLPSVEWNNFLGFHVRHAWFPYGILLFALSGGVVIPDVIAFLGKKRGVVVRAITIGTLLPALLYLLFAFVVVGVSGSTTSQDAISGIGRIAGVHVALLGSIVGLLAVFTSSIVLSASAQSLLRLDLSLRAPAPWFVVSALPLGLFFLGLQDFLAIVGVVGAFAIGIDFLLVIAVHHNLAQKEKRGVMARSWWEYPMYAIVALGMVYEFLKFNGFV